MRERLFAAGEEFSEEAIRNAAREVKLDMTAWEAAYAAQESLDAVRGVGKQAKSDGLRGTPTDVLGRASSDSVTGATIFGAQPLKVFEAEIAKQLSETRPQ